MAEHAAALARVSSSRSPQDAIAAFAGGALPHTILSCCQGTLLDMFSTQAVLPLRATCRDAAAAVAGHPWDDLETAIRGYVGPTLLPTGPGAQKGAWRACFPRARGASLSEDPWSGPCRRTPVVDADLAHLAGLRRLRLRWCRKVTDAAFVHMGGIQSLDMSHCPLVTDAGFAHLRGIKSLNMQRCSQPTITDAAFAHLVGIQHLEMNCCDQPTITDAAFVHLRGIQSLDMTGCWQSSITDAAFVPLAGIQSLDMSFCDQPTITDAAFVSLAGIQRLYMSCCRQASITGAAFPHLKGIQCLNMHGCSKATFAAARAAGLSVQGSPVHPPWTLGGRMLYFLSMAFSSVYSVFVTYT